MGNIVIASPALGDAATLTFGGTLSSSLPGANLQTMQPGEVARWTDLSGMYIQVDLLASTSWNCVALIGHNGSATGTWQVQADADSADLTGTPTYGSTSMSLWKAAGKPSGYTGVPLPSMLFLSTARTERYLRIDITDASNGDGYFQAGRLYVCNAWQPSRNISYQWSVGFIDDSPRDIAMGGQLWPTERSGRRRVLQFRLGFQSEDDVYENMYELMRVRGTARDVLVSVDPDADKHFIRQTFIGLITGLEPIINTTFNIFELNVRVEEMLP